MSTFYQYPVVELRSELVGIAERLLTPRKGILCCDDSTGGMGKRLQDIGVKNTEENRRRYRDLLATADPAVSEFLSGIVLVHETVYHRTDDGSSIMKNLTARGIVAGIRVDRGVVPVLGTEQECGSQGLDDLAQRCCQYKKDGCHFAKWRCVYKTSRFTPSYQIMIENANELARFASITQAQRMLPLLQVELMSEGEHDLERSTKIMESILSFLVKALSDHNVYLEGILIMVSIVSPGSYCKINYNPMDQARATVTALLRTIPVAVPGIVFSSGALEADEVNTILTCINTVDLRRPWRLTYGFSRSIQIPVLKVWSGQDANKVNAQVELINQLRNAGHSSVGTYSKGLVSGQKNLDNPK